MFEWALGNTVVAALFALAAALVSRVQSTRPALSHLMWVMALAALVMPRIPGLTTPGSELRSRVHSLVAPAVVARAVPTASETLPSVGQYDLFDDADVVGAALATSGNPIPSPVATTWFSSVPTRIWLPLTWLLGGLIVLLSSVRRVLPFQRRVRGSLEAPATLRREVQRVAIRFGLRAPSVRLLNGIVSPSVWCLGRPLLLWPSNPGSQNASSARSTLIAHELAHLARRDHWLSWLDVPASALFWWNPLFWLIRGRIRHFAELSCDAWAVWAYPVDRRAFAEALIDLQARTATVPIPAQGLGATDSEFKDFERRLNMIMKKRVFHGVSKSAIAVALIATFLASPGLSEGGKKAKYAVAPAVTVPVAVQNHIEVAQAMKKAEGFYKEGQYDQAFDAYMEVSELDPGNGRAHARLGYILIVRDEYDSAVKHFKQQYKAGHDRPNALYNMACASTLAGDNEKALKALKHAVGHGFANMKLLNSDTDLNVLRADAVFQELVARASAGIALQEGIAAAKKSGDMEMITGLLGELAQILTYDGEILASHGRAALVAQDHGAAAWAFGRQVEIGNNVATANYNLACALALMGDVNGGIEALGQARDAGMGYEPITQDVDFDNLRSDARFAALEQAIAEAGIARIELQKMLKSGAGAKALPGLKKMAGSAAPGSKDHGWAVQALGRELLDEGRYQDAIAVFERAAEQGYAVERSAFYQAEALTALGQEESALRHVKYAVELGFGDAEMVHAVLASNSYCTSDDRAQLADRAAMSKKKGYGRKKKGYADAAYGTNKKVAVHASKGSTE